MYLCIDMRVDMRIGMCIDIRIGLHIDMCTDMCIDMCMVKWVFNLSSVQDQGNGFVIVGSVSRLGRAGEGHI